ncbi:MAG: EthD family reductase [Chloroflexi bacterium]|nr:MAG: EthD family reductase [Chloroflexota bacterium]
MVKLTIFFRRPADISAFEDHFAHRHVPLIAAMPGVARTSVSRALGAPRGEPPYYLIHDVYFADMAALNYALNSAQGRAAGADLMMFARDIVSLMFAGYGAKIHLRRRALRKLLLRLNLHRTLQRPKPSKLPLQAQKPARPPQTAHRRLPMPHRSKGCRASRRAG